MEKDYKLIFNPGVARNLLKKGFNIVDIKADKNDSSKTIFVFALTPEFEVALTTINEEIKKSREGKDSE